MMNLRDTNVILFEACLLNQIKQAIEIYQQSEQRARK